MLLFQFDQFYLEGLIVGLILVGTGVLMVTFFDEPEQ